MEKYIGLLLEEAVEFQKKLHQQGLFYNIKEETLSRGPLPSYYLIPTCPKGFQPLWEALENFKWKQWSIYC